MSGIVWDDHKTYKELASTIAIPSAFGYVLTRIAYRLSREKSLGIIQRFLNLCGRATIPIMFLHIPLNHWKSTVGYNRLVYAVIGIEIPIVFTLLFYRNRIMRILFGLPDLSRY